jgi:hypothetical protein
MLKCFALLVQCWTHVELHPRPVCCPVTVPLPVAPPNCVGESPGSRHGSGKLDLPKG